MTDSEIYLCVISIAVVIEAMHSSCIIIIGNMYIEKHIVPKIPYVSCNVSTVTFSVRTGFSLCCACKCNISDFEVAVHDG